MNVFNFESGLKRVEAVIREPLKRIEPFDLRCGYSVEETQRKLNEVIRITNWFIDETNKCMMTIQKDSSPTFFVSSTIEECKKDPKK